MKALIKIILTFFLFFLTLFFIIHSLDLLNFEQVESLLKENAQKDQNILFLLVIILLILDFFISIPTLPLSILSGYLLGFPLAFTCVSIGLMSSGLVGYFLGTFFGEKILSIILKKSEEKQQLKESYAHYGVSIMLFSRAIPMLPEVSSALAGVNNLKFKKFFFVWLLNCLPYACLTTYMGSISTIESPEPSFILIIGFYLLLWFTGYLIFTRRKYANN